MKAFINSTQPIRLWQLVAVAAAGFIAGLPWGVIFFLNFYIS